MTVEFSGDLGLTHQGLERGGNRDFGATASPPPPDVIAPVVDNFSPANGELPTTDTPLFFDVTDNLGLFRSIVVAVTEGAGFAVAHDSVDFQPPYAAQSTRVSIAGGFRYRLRRTGGWSPDGSNQIHVKVWPTDTAGN